MIYTWYYIFNSDEFNLLGIPSRTYTVILDGIGQRDVLVTKGNLFGLTYNDVFLPLELNQKNPFEFENLAVQVHDNKNVFLGIAVPDED